MLTGGVPGGQPPWGSGGLAHHREDGKGPVPSLSLTTSWDRAWGLPLGGDSTWEVQAILGLVCGPQFRSVEGSRAGGK